jgi:signal transduction histidine kinase
LAHEFNNQFTSILGNVSLARETVPPDHESQEMLNAVIEASRRATDLVQMMLVTAGYKPRGKERLELAEVVNSAIRNRPLPDNVRIRTESEDVVVSGDRQTFETLFWSLISNAAESYGDGEGEVLVTIREGTPPRRMPDTVIVEEGRERQGNWVEIAVEDKGAGMARDVVDRAFEPFYSSKFAGRGLGLPAVRGIVRAYEGKLILATAPGKGTRVEVWLPKDDQDKPH